jgi:hypothetical protein
MGAGYIRNRIGQGVGMTVWKKDNTDNDAENTKQ